MLQCLSVQISRGIRTPPFSLFMTSDFVTSVSCVQNNSWHVSHRMQGMIDQFEDFSGEYPVHVISVAFV